jgi:hypothetical protein
VNQRFDTMRREMTLERGPLGRQHREEVINVPGVELRRQMDMRACELLAISPSDGRGAVRSAFEDGAGEL